MEAAASNTMLMTQGCKSGDVNELWKNHSGDREAGRPQLQEGAITQESATAAGKWVMIHMMVTSRQTTKYYSCGKDRHIVDYYGIAKTSSR